MREAFLDIQHLLEVGGSVLATIFVVALVMWTLIFERFLYGRFVHPARADEVARTWDRLPDKSTWNAHALRRLWMSELMMDLDKWLAAIRALIAVCPLLGLLGTTTGMVEVYEVMAIEGSSEPRAMASGVSEAMVTTMAGLIVALSGIFFSFRLESSLIAERERLAFRLHIDEDLLGHHHRTRSAKAKAKAREANRRHREQLARRGATATQASRDPTAESTEVVERRSRQG